MLLSHAHNFHSVHNQLHLPFQINSSVYNEVKFEGLRFMSDLDYLFYPRSEFAQITQNIFNGVVPQRMYAFFTLNATLSYIRYILAFRTVLL